MHNNLKELLKIILHRVEKFTKVVFFTNYVAFFSVQLTIFCNFHWQVDQDNILITKYETLK